MTEIILVRHCATTGQDAEAELTCEGAQQAAALVATLSSLELDAVYSSPYRRAVATVEPFLQHAGLALHLDARLRERELAASPHDWLAHQRRSFEDPDYRLPGGESMRETRARAMAALAEVRGRRALVVSHGTQISCLLGLDFEAWRTMRNPALYQLTDLG